MRIDAAHSTRHLEEFLSLKCAPDLLLARVFPNAKEITESMGAFHAAREYLWRAGFAPNNGMVDCVVVGDGHTPRTGALFAYRTRWTVRSIDPCLRTIETTVRRLTLMKAKIEDVPVAYYETVLIVLVHSHAHPAVCLEKIHATRRALIEIPCCFPGLDSQPCWEYQDPGILSLHNTVRVWDAV